jgi:hypothetical protein
MLLQKTPAQSPALPSYFGSEQARESGADLSANLMIPRAIAPHPIGLARVLATWHSAGHEGNQKGGNPTHNVE